MTIRRDSIRSLVNGIRRGDAFALARSISLLENRPSLGAKLLRHARLLRRRGFSGRMIGITGSAGSGKSTLIAAIAKVMRENRKRVGIIAVDPTSPKSGGAFLGDRVRMQELAEDPSVFIRSMASRGAKGGLAPATRGAAFLLLRAGYDFVLIETVGAGQLDDEVTKLADMTLLVLTPEAGDGIQLMKAGLRELVDGFVLNKAERPGAQAMEDFLKRALGGEQSEAPVFKTVAEQRKGIEPIYRHILKRCNIRVRK